MSRLKLFFGFLFVIEGIALGILVLIFSLNASFKTNILFLFGIGAIASISLGAIILVYRK